MSNQKSNGVNKGLIAALIGGALAIGAGAAIGVEEYLKFKKQKVTAEQKPKTFINENKEVSEHFICPITQEIMKDPVNTPCGHAFEKKNAEDWVTKKGTCPQCRAKLTLSDLKPCYALKNAIAEYMTTKK